MRTLNVALGTRSYPIHIGTNVLQDTSLFTPFLKHRRAFVVTNAVVAPLYLETLLASLKQAGIRVDSLILPDGEAHKNWETLNLIFDAMLEQRCERSTVLIALGGGVVGDVAGFAAACYQRGMPFIQVPTSLLAQVDSSVGGKTAINHPRGKNMIGAFYQPQVVIADTSVLNTLPDRELKAGLAEIIKYGLIRDLDFFVWLETHMETLLLRDPALIAEAVERSCANKAQLVAADETEHGERALLNLGHTFGHAIEAALGYGVWLHGEAVAAGTMMAAELSRKLGWLTRVDVLRIERLHQRAGLPVLGPPGVDAETYLELMSGDKKVEDGVLHLVLLGAIGRGVIYAHADRGDIVSAIQGRSA